MDEAVDLFRDVDLLIGHVVEPGKTTTDVLYNCLKLPVWGGRVNYPQRAPTSPFAIRAAET